LSTLCKVMAEEYAERGGGVPDLFLWKVFEKEEGSEQGESLRQANLDGSVGSTKTREHGEIIFAEVKSENDRLSDTQRLWIHVLTGAGIKVELCHAVASEVRVVD
jgi:Fanconi-associated nuclease 1